jgi:Domain of unknown function (DUF4279)
MGHGQTDNEIYFAYRATLRISGDIANLDEITQRLGIAPTDAHRRGDSWAPRLPPYKDDLWSYTAPLEKNEPLYLHIDALWNTFREHKPYLLQLKEHAKVDVFLGYRSNCDHCGVDVPYRSLEMFRELQIPFALSIIVA